MTEIKRNGVIYTQHPNGTLTCDPLDQSGMVGGSGEEVRNQEHNPIRLARIKEFHPNPRLLDFGCGSGMLVEYLQENGISALGYDKYWERPASKIALGPNNILPGAFPRGFDVVTMIEVIEHLSAPYDELDTILACLKPGGVLMIETSFTDWMDLQTDPYINPALGHSTIFSHKGLDELMKEKGFELYQEINRNVQVYKKPGEIKFEPKITLITMGQANPIALKRTMDSFREIVDEIIFGDLLIFEDDREKIVRYMDEYPLEIVRLPFNHIFEHGFSATLNELALHATNDWVLYMNVSEVMDGAHPIKEQMSNLYNCYSFDHAVEEHRWFRLYNRKELRWGGLIHEELTGELRPCPFNIFRMADTEKDLDDPLKAKVANDVKELCYWAQFQKLVEHPDLRANTHPGWIQHAEEAYQSHMDRMAAKGKRLQAFQEGNLTMYLEDIYTNPDFEKERFESNTILNFQGDRKLL
jgi:SAM-dependent methyltransferase